MEAQVLFLYARVQDVTGHPLLLWSIQLLAWRPASVVLAIRTRTECDERIVCQTALGSVTVWRTAQQIVSLSSSVVSVTAHTVRTPSSASLQDSQHCWSLFNNTWLEKCREIAPSVWTLQCSHHTVANRWNEVGNWVNGRLRQHSGGAQPMLHR